MTGAAVRSLVATVPATGDVRSEALVAGDESLRIRCLISSRPTAEHRILSTACTMRRNENPKGAP